MLAMVYGKSIGGYDNTLNVLSINLCLRRLSDALRPGAWRVDHLPWLKYIPGYLTPLRQAHREELQLFSRLLGEVKDALVSSLVLLFICALPIVREPGPR